MTFEEILDQAIAMLQRRGRMTYRTLQRQFALDEDALNDLKDEFLYTHPEVRDDAGRGLVWTDDASPAPPAASPSARNQDGEPLSYTPPYLAEKILTARPILKGERKQVTVLFADIKDSTELIKDLDPEAAQQLLDPALHHMMDAVHRYEGTVNQVLGDGIMALLGAPIGHENHAIRACYAALAMQAALRGYTEEVRRAHGCELRIRVGLNAGEVVVRTISNDLHMDYSAVGQTTHLAARMEQMATPGTIRLTAATLRLVDGLVQVHALGPLPVRGTAIPLLERTVVLSQDADFPVFFRIAAPVLALAYALAGRATDALALLEQVEENQITYAPSLASEEAYLRAGCVEEAHRLTRRTLTNAHDHNRRGQEARALWLLGEIARHRDPSDVVQAEAYYQQALTLTEALGMRPLVAHCHLGLGRLYHQIGRAEQARIALTTAIDLYRAMAMTFWLPQAEAPLAQVEGQ